MPSDLKKYAQYLMVGRQKNKKLTKTNCTKKSVAKELVGLETNFLH